ncbi:MAG: isoaspartyl peptidase/L-asparaginase family protein [Nitrospira sp.]|nr:isoaspartyl peptidase/L-asparaginase family protein [Nitrospira sp.]
MNGTAPLILAHGGAGSRSITSEQQELLGAALRVGYHLLDRGAPAATAVEQTIRVLERSGRFNAGLGARLQLDGGRRMDASIMEGKNLQAGAVASIEDIVHPITAARLVMEETNHVLLVGPMATVFANHFKLERQRSPALRRRVPYGALLKRTKPISSRHGTVGAVAVDRFGTVAAGASTGGIARMLPGRVGDTPLIGCGVYADNRAGAVSMTGIGEGIIRIAAAKAICDRLAGGAVPIDSARQVLKMLVARIQGSAGSLVVTPAARFAIVHVTPYMAAGWWNGKGEPVVGDRFERVSIPTSR